MFQMSEAALITHAGFNIGSITGSDPVTYTISLHKIHEFGYPSDSTLTSTHFTPAPTDSGFQWYELAIPYQTYIGEKLCIKVSYYSGPISATNFMEIRMGINGGFAVSFPYTYMVNDSFSGKHRWSGNPYYGIKGQFKAFGFPLDEYTYATVNSPEEHGLRFYMSTSWGSTFTLRGILITFYDTTGSTLKDFDLVLYSQSGQIQRLLGVPCDMFWDGGYLTVCARLIWPGTYSTLNFGEEYFITVSPNQANANIRIALYSFAHFFDMSAMPGGSGFYYGHRASPTSDWVRERDKRPLVDLIFDDWTG
jgi:hypothetical protein